MNDEEKKGRLLKTTLSDTKWIKPFANDQDVIISMHVLNQLCPKSKGTVKICEQIAKRQLRMSAKQILCVIRKTVPPITRFRNTLTNSRLYADQFEDEAHNRNDHLP